MTLLSHRGFIYAAARAFFPDVLATISHVIISHQMKKSHHRGDRHRSFARQSNYRHRACMHAAMHAHDYTPPMWRHNSLKGHCVNCHRLPGIVGKRPLSLVQSHTCANETMGIANCNKLTNSFHYDVTMGISASYTTNTLHQALFCPLHMHSPTSLFSFLILQHVSYVFSILLFRSIACVLWPWTRCYTE